MAASMTSPALTEREHRRLADVLLKAARDAEPVDPFSGRYPELRVPDACRIREAVLGRRLAAGERLIGAKTRVARDARGGRRGQRVGFLTSDMLLRTPVVEMARLIHPVVEAKLAFVLDGPPPPAAGTLTDLLARTVRIRPCIEIVDSRYDPRHPSFLDDLADSYGASKLLLGEGVPPGDLPVDGLSVRLEMDGTGPGREPEPPPGPDGFAGLFDGAIERRALLAEGSLLLSPALTSPWQIESPGRVCALFGMAGSLRLEAR
jgi:2-keto-4-pentenoate hydratase